MALTFPVFLRDRDGWMYFIRAMENLDQDLERIDVEDGEYRGWDSHGWPVELSLQGPRISCEIVDLEGSPAVGELKAAIMNYATIAGPKNEPFSPSDTGDILTLFLEAEAHVKKSSIAHRLGSLFRRP